MFKLWSAARAAAKSGLALLKRVELSVLIGVLSRIADLERQYATAGSGGQKLDALLSWVRSTFPSAASWLDEVRAFVQSAVALFNALGWFRK